jgi:hypothetical protein
MWKVCAIGISNFSLATQLFAKKSVCIHWTHHPEHIILTMPCPRNTKV